jgi:hypothetical protein
VKDTVERLAIKMLVACVTRTFSQLFNQVGLVENSVGVVEVVTIGHEPYDLSLRPLANELKKTVKVFNCPLAEKLMT